MEKEVQTEAMKEGEHQEKEQSKLFSVYLNPDLVKEVDRFLIDSDDYKDRSKFIEKAVKLLLEKEGVSLETQ